MVAVSSPSSSRHLALKAVDAAPTTLSRTVPSPFRLADAAPPLFHAYAAYACAGQLEAWSCAWCIQDMAVHNTSAPSLIAVIYSAEADVQAFVAYFEGIRTLDVVFRGLVPGSTTNKLAFFDAALVADRPIPSSSAEEERLPKVHRGMHAAYLQVRTQLLQAVDGVLSRDGDGADDGVQHIRVIGHDTGGALASIAAPDIISLADRWMQETYYAETASQKQQQQTPPAGKDNSAATAASGVVTVNVYSFGAPAVGNSYWADEHERLFRHRYGSESWRITSLLDFLPDLIPAGLVHAPVWANATAAGVDASQIVDHFPLEFADLEGFAHAGRHVRWVKREHLPPGDRIGDHFNKWMAESAKANFNFLQHDSLPIVNKTGWRAKLRAQRAENIDLSFMFGVRFGSSDDFTILTMPNGSLSTSFSCKPPPPEEYTILYGSCLNLESYEMCRKRFPFYLWPATGYVNLFSSRDLFSRGDGPTSMLWILMVQLWTGTGSGRWAARDQEGALIPGPNPASAVNHYQYLGYDMYACVAPQDPFCTSSEEVASADRGAEILRRPNSASSASQLFSLYLNWYALS